MHRVPFLPPIPAMRQLTLALSLLAACSSTGADEPGATTSRDQEFADVGPAAEKSAEKAKEVVAELPADDAEEERTLIEGAFVESNGDDIGPQETGDPQFVNRVEVIVNDEILTYRQIMVTASRQVPEGTTPTPRQLSKLRKDVGIALVGERLRAQGGIDMGIDEQTIKDIVAKNTQKRIDAAGGAIKMTNELDDKGVSLFAQESAMRRDLYRFSWERAITGVDPGISGRAFRDRYVRPGQLRLRYELLEAGQIEAESISGTSARYHIQQIVLPVTTDDDIEPARVRAMELLKKLEDGMDFTAAVQGLADPPENDGILQPLTGEQLARNGGPEVAAFALSAAHGELSGPIPIIIDRVFHGWRLMKLLDSDTPLLPIFEIPRTQALLRRTLQSDRDDYHRSEGMKTLHQGAYIWSAGPLQS